MVADPTLGTTEYSGLSLSLAGAHALAQQHAARISFRALEIAAAHRPRSREHSAGVYADLALRQFLAGCTRVGEIDRPLARGLGMRLQRSRHGACSETR